MTKIVDIRHLTAGGKSKRSLSQIKNIARHHSATPTGDYFSFWKTWKSKGWLTGGYHEIILRDGSVQLCYDPNVITNGILGHNTNTYHISLVGNGSFTKEQEVTFNDRCRIVMDKFNVPIAKVLGHREFSGTNTACPGIDMRMVRLNLGKGEVTVPTTKTEVKGVTSSKKADKDISAIQAKMNSLYKTKLTADGIRGPRTVEALLKGLQIELNRQYSAGLVVDGKWGFKTAAAVHSVKFGAKGNIIYILQAMLYIQGFDVKGVDGIFGTDTEAAVKAFQKSKNLIDDGIIGENTIIGIFRI